MSAADGIVETGNAQAWIGGVHAGVAIREAQLRAQQQQIEAQHYQQMFGVATDRTAASREHWQGMANAAAVREQNRMTRYGDAQNERYQQSLGLDHRALNEGMFPTDEDGNIDEDKYTAFSAQPLNAKASQLGNFLANRNRQERVLNTNAKALQAKLDAFTAMPGFADLPIDEQHAQIAKIEGNGIVAAYLHSKNQSLEAMRGMSATLDPNTGQPMFTPDEVESAKDWDKRTIENFMAKRMSSSQQIQQQAQGLQAANPNMAPEQAVGRAQAGARMAPVATGAKSDEAAASANAERQARGQLAEFWTKHEMAKFNPGALTTQEREELAALEGNINTTAQATQAAIRGPKPTTPMPQTPPAAAPAPAMGPPAPEATQTTPPPLDPQTANTLQKMLGTFKQQTGRDYNRQDPNDVAAMRQIEQSLTGGG